MANRRILFFADAPDLQKAAEASALGIFRNSGQVCVAGSRLLVQRAIHDQFIEALQNIANKLRVGDPLDLTTQIGAVSSQEQLQKDLSYVQIAQQEGAELVAGGSRLHEDTGGFYMQPTIFTQVTPKMSLAREEVFGPVLGVMSFENEAEAIHLANDSNYGLASAVWTSNLSTAHRMIRALQAGVVHVNCYGGSEITVPLGGVKQSGNGVDKSLHALDKYCDLKTAWIQL